MSKIDKNAFINNMKELAKISTIPVENLREIVNLAKTYFQQR